MSKSKIFLIICLAFIAGIFFSSFFKISQLFILALLILAVFLISLFSKYKKILVCGLFILFLVLGIYRHQQALVEVSLEEVEVDLVVRIVGEVDVRDNNIKLIVKGEDIPGKILVTLNRYPEYSYASKLRLRGKLEVPVVFEEFNYKDYLLKDNIHFVMYYPKVELLAVKDYSVVSFIYAQVLNFKDKLRVVVRQVMSPPQGAILSAMVLGDKRQMSNSLKDKLGITGLSHVTAVSGLHITILSAICMSLLLKLGFWRKRSFYVVVILLVLFIFMTGLQSSAIRAGIMGVLFMFSQYIGRLGNSSRTVLFALAIMLAFNPLLLTLDVGFQLSFLAVLGIIYLAPILKKWVKLDILATTLSAQVFTLPILIYNFGYVSWVAPFTNILVVPIVSFIMLFGFIFILLGLLWLPLGFIFSFLAWLPLSYLLKIVDWFSLLPTFNFKVSGVWLFIIYSILVVVTFCLNKKATKHSLIAF